MPAARDKNITSRRWHYIWLVTAFCQCTKIFSKNSVPISVSIYRDNFKNLNLIINHQEFCLKYFHAVDFLVYFFRPPPVPLVTLSCNTNKQIDVYLRTPPIYRQELNNNKPQHLSTCLFINGWAICGIKVWCKSIMVVWCVYSDESHRFCPLCGIWWCIHSSIHRSHAWKSFISNVETYYFDDWNFYRR